MFASHSGRVFVCNGNLYCQYGPSLEDVHEVETRSEHRVAKRRKFVMKKSASEGEIIPAKFINLIANGEFGAELMIELYTTNKTLLFRIANHEKVKDSIYELLGVRGVPFSPSFKGLLPHQDSVLSWMKQREDIHSPYNIKGAILCLKMGLGKTLISLTHLMSSPKGEYPTLVVCSKTVMNVWKDEIEKFFGRNIKVLFFHELFMGQEIKHINREALKKYDVIVTTYDVCKSVCRRHPEILEDCFVRGEENGILRDKIIRIDSCSLETLNNREVRNGQYTLYCTPFHRIVFDESQVFANPKTTTYKAVMALYGKYKWCLTGTPIRNYTTDIWAQFRVLGYDREGARNSLEWKRNLALWEKDKLYEYVFKMDYAEAGIELPPIYRFPLSTDKPLILSKDEKEVYDFVLGKSRDIFDKMMKKMCTFACVLALFTRLRQCTIAPYLITNESKRKTKRKEIKEIEVAKMMKEIESGPLSKICHDKEGPGGMQSTKIQQIISTLKSFPENEKVIVFSTFTSCLDLLADAVRVYFPEFTFSQLDGDVVGSERNNILYQFRNNQNVRGLFLTYKVGSEGLNLTVASRCICVEPWWTPAVMDQAHSRLYRTGQTKSVFTYEPFISGTIEEKVREICDKKKEMAAGFLDLSKGKMTKNVGLDKNTLSEILGMKDFWN